MKFSPVRIELKPKMNAPSVAGMTPLADFVLFGRLKNEDQQPVHLICDTTYIRKYAFGAVPPLAAERRRAVR